MRSATVERIWPSTPTAAPRQFAPELRRTTLRAQAFAESLDAELNEAVSLLELRGQSQQARTVLLAKLAVLQAMGRLLEAL